MEIAPKAYKNLRNPLPPQTQTNGSEGLPSVTEMDQDFPGKVLHCRHVLLFRSLSDAFRRKTEEGLNGV